jgi:hypothetical protein
MNCRNVAKGLLKKHSKPTKQRTALNGTGPRNGATYGSFANASNLELYEPFTSLFSTSIWETNGPFQSPSFTALAPDHASRYWGESMVTN